MKRWRTGINNTVIVIGGGAAGLMAAIAAAEAGREVLLFEKNEKLGRKLRITGKGRCNLTNNCDAQGIIAAAPGNGRFLYSALSAFAPTDTMAFFEALGVPLKTERGNRVFPVSDSANQVADALGDCALARGVRLERQAVQEVLAKEGRVTGVRSGGKVYPARAVLIATGGASYQATGSTGDGYRFAKQLGHRVTALRPSLVAVTSPEEACAQMQGLALKNCGVKLMEQGKSKPVYEDFGELLFTHFGLSGPVVLSASAHMRGDCAYTFVLDLKPALSFEQLDARLLREFEQSGNRSFENIMAALLPRKMIPVAVGRSGIAGETQGNAVTRVQRHGLIALLKGFAIEADGFRPLNEAIVTAGGVCVKEINPKTMESKLVGGLYFAGEVVDVDAYTGGNNLQIAFSTGRLAGLSMGQENE